MKVFDLLTADALTALKLAISKLDYQDGINTARGKAKNIKKNLQITEADPNGKRLLSAIKKKIIANESIEYYALIRNIVGVRIANYRDGGYYGWHVDMATMNGFRTDLSFTVFLNDPGEYEGGELQIDYGVSKTSFKGKSGQIVVYPTGQLHRVTPVTKGERLVVVGWIQSCVAIEEDRLALLRMAGEISRVAKLIPDNKDEELNQLRYLYQYFRRRLYS